MKNFMRIFFPFQILFMAADGAGGGGGQGEDQIEMTNPVTKESVMVPKRLEGFIGTIASYNRRKALEKKQEDMDTLQTTIDNLTVELESAKKNKGRDSDEVANVKKTHAAEITKLNEKIMALTKSEASSRILYEDEKIRGEIMAELPVSHLWDPIDTLETIKRKGKARLVEKTDAMTGEGTNKFDVVLTLTIPDENKNLKQVNLSPAEAVKKFLSLDENKFRLRNKLTPGGDSQTSSIYPGSAPQEMTTEEFNKMSAKDRNAYMEGGGVLK